MPFTPHTDEDIRAMLAAIGAARVEDLFEEIPRGLLDDALPGVPGALSEMEVGRLMRERARADGHWTSFLGAGVYEHHIPAAVWQMAARGEFYSAYTPYQAEASQGTLQLLYEFQTMMAELTGLDASNASLYDGASALGEAILMAVRAHPRSRRILMPRSVHPAWRGVARTLTRNQGIEIVEVPFDAESGRVDARALEDAAGGGAAALVVAQPNYFGVLEDADALADWAHAREILVVAAVNPVAIALVKPPGAWGATGADIAVGDGQPLGCPPAGGGPYFGFMCSREKLVRQMPGRMVGRTVDADGKPGYTLTLQAREQHIRRGKATSNICTNQGLMAAAGTMHLAILGPAGLRRVAQQCHANALALVERLTAVAGVERVFDAPFFHEALLRLPGDTATVLRALEAQGILGGVPVADDYPELGPALLVCATETKSAGDLEAYASHLDRILGKRRQLPPCAQRRR